MKKMNLTGSLVKNNLSYLVTNCHKIKNPIGTLLIGFLIAL